jgi:hypothetical protein
MLQSRKALNFLALRQVQASQIASGDTNSLNQYYVKATSVIDGYLIL